MDLETIYVLKKIQLWHYFHLQLSVDNVAMSTRIESGGTRYLDLSDSFYLGGIESEKRQRAFAKGIKAADSSIMVSLIDSNIAVKLSCNA